MIADGYGRFTTDGEPGYFDLPSTGWDARDDRRAGIRQAAFEGKAGWTLRASIASI